MDKEKGIVLVSEPDVPNRDGFFNFLDPIEDDSEQPLREVFLRVAAELLLVSLVCCEDSIVCPGIQ